MLSRFINRGLPYLGAWPLRMLLRAKRWWKPSRKPSIAHFLEAYRHSKKEVFLVQVGAHGAQINDPIFQHIVLHRWRGLLIEPQAEGLATLQQVYRHCEGMIFENIAISDHIGTQDFYSVEKTPDLPGWVDQLSSFRREVPASVLSTYPQARIVSQSIPCTTLTQLFQKHQISRVDLLVLDTEGYDAVILEQYDFHRYAPELILYEHCHLSEVEKQSLEQLLTDQAYTLFPEGFNTLAQKST